MCSNENLYEESDSSGFLHDEKDKPRTLFESTDSEMGRTVRDAKNINILSGGVSPEAWSTNSDSPTPTNSTTGRPWAKDILWQGLLGDEHRLLLGTEEESSDRHSSDDDVIDTDIESIYRINSEQFEYYKKQFSIIQPDSNGLVSGHIAKIFFEKSGIPVGELRHIWQLCDVTKDGALSLPEFVAAMHLVVLRRNSIPLPQILPACLNPNKLMQEEQPRGQTPPRDANLLNLDDEENFQPIESIDSDKFPRNFTEKTTVLHSQSQFNDSSSPADEDAATKNHSASHSPRGEPMKTPPSGRKDLNKEWANQSRQWTKFPESPISNVSSPGLKPANFDMQRTAQAVVSDPQILHPVPLRVTPVDTFKPNEAQKCNFQPVNRDLPQVSESSVIQRPSKKSTTKNICTVPSLPQREMNVSVYNDESADLVTKPEMPPLPPPRPYRHTRSSSLDLNKLKLNNSETTRKNSHTNNVPAADTSGVIVGFSNFAHFSNFSQKENNNKIKNSTLSAIESSSRLPSTSPQQSQHNSAFEVYRKPINQHKCCNSAQCNEHDSSCSPNTGVGHNQCLVGIPEYLRSSSHIHGQNITDVLRNLKQHNALLLHLCKNLSEELLLTQQYKEEVRNNINCCGNSLRDESLPGNVVLTYPSH